MTEPNLLLEEVKEKKKSKKKQVKSVFLKIFSYSQKRKKLLLFAFFALLFAFVLLVWLVSQLSHTTPEKLARPKTQQQSHLFDQGQALSEIKKQEAKIESEVAHKKTTVNLNPLVDQLNQLQNSLSQLSNEKANNKTLIESQNKKVEASLATLMQEMGRLQKSLKPVVYLDSSKLPFRVLSIDQVQQQPLITVFYHQTYIPIQRGDTLSGWTLVKVDYGHQTVEFENKAHQFIRVVLKGEVA